MNGKFLFKFRILKLNNEALIENIKLSGTRDLQENPFLIIYGILRNIPCYINKNL